MKTFTRSALLFYILIAAWSCSPTRKYEKQPGVLSWEKDIRDFEHRDSIESYPSDAILFAGSSSIRLWSSIQEDLKPYSVIQRGYGGAKLSDFAVYCQRIIYPHQFKALVIFVANDITGNEKDKEPEEVLDLFKYVVKQVRKKYREQPVFFIQITPTNSRWKVWDKISEVNRLINNFCLSKKNLHYMKTSESFIGADGKPKGELFREDQLHLNEAGYEIWSSIIKQNLDTILK